MLTSAIPTLDHILDDVLGRVFRGEADAATFRIPSDIREKNDEYTFQFDVPGVKMEDVEITLTNRVLALRGERRSEGRDNEKVACGRPHGRFAASYALPDSADGDNLTADLANGVLTIRVPKQPKAQPRKIRITSGAERKQLAE